MSTRCASRPLCRTRSYNILILCWLPCARVSLFTPPPFETGVCDRLAARCGIRAASRDRGPCPPCPDAPPTAPRSRLRVRPADRLSLPPAKPVRAASSCLTRRPCGVEATPLDAVWHGSPHGRARTAQPRRLEERRARTGDMGCAFHPPARCAAPCRTPSPRFCICLPMPTVVHGAPGKGSNPKSAFGTLKCLPSGGR